MEIYRNASYLLVLCHLANIIAGRVMSNQFRFDVTNGYSRYIAIEYSSPIVSDSMGREGVIKCNKVTNVISLCIQI